MTHRRPLLLALLTLVALSALAQPAQARKNLWATVNICDSVKYPDRVGIAARMPGDGSTLRMYMKFYVQYKRDGEWVNVKTNGKSPWLSAGSAQYTWSERGYTFAFDPPAAGTSFTMRGFVRFQWRRGSNVIKTASLITSAGRPTSDADPPGYSEARCKLSGPPLSAG